ncbi:unnamed protein product [Clonostachys solani]|uniref:Heterokaryon incompatibility domain-containing protein n=1 Tax=Clonostachys solani TaxID=160281 RepID=A0A9N9YTJ2_9HYPO|nr:unnamed protein product [Clonostachys solani]
MSTEQEDEKILCAQCMSIFTGQQQLKDPSISSDRGPVHHFSAASFEAAANSGCIICTRARAALRRDELDCLSMQVGHEPFSYCLLSKNSEELYTLEIIIYYAVERLLEGEDGRKRFVWETHLRSTEKAREYGCPSGNDMACYTYTPHTGSEGSFNQARKWYSDCREKHARCNVSRRSLSYSPTRLLDLNYHGSDLRLIMTAEETIKEDYATLSHCWGGQSIIKLTTDTLAQFQNKIGTTSLPQTFRDAILVARRLGIRYLWIDSLCIIQDSLEDWQKEAALMGEVYSNSTLNVMATACRNSHQSLFRSRDQGELLHYTVRTEWDGIKPETCYILSRWFWDNHTLFAPLNRRGWVLQERILPPRALHFTYNQLVWECREQESCEMYPDGLPRFLKSMNYSFVKHLDIDASQAWLTHLQESSLSQRDCYEKWLRVIRMYWYTRTTKDTDKLVAISGLAKRMGGALKDRYLAGLWEGNLPSNLLWYVHIVDGKCCRPENYRAPSWSWASIEANEGVNLWHTPLRERVLVEIEEASVTPLSNIDVTGEVIDGHLRLRGSVLQAELIIHDPSAREESGRLQIRVQGEKVDGKFFPDENITATSTSVYCLPVWVATKPLDNKEGAVALILKPVDGKPRGWYSRLGLLNNSPYDKDLSSGGWKKMLECLDDPGSGDHSVYLEADPGTIMFV